MVKRLDLTESKNSIVEIGVDNVRCLHGKFSTRLAGDNRGRKHELLEWLQTNTVHEPCQIEGTEHIPFALIYSISESVCKSGVACEALGFLGKETEGESSRIVEGGWCGSICKSAGRLEDEATDEVEVRVDTMLLG